MTNAISAQPAPTTITAMQAPATAQPIYTIAPAVMTGGFGSASVTDPSVRAAVQAAIAQEAKKTGHKITLSSIDSAQQQVVAGENFKLTLTVMDNGHKATVDAFVFEALPYASKGKSPYTLESWKETPVKSEPAHHAASQLVQAMASFAPAHAVVSALQTAAAQLHAPLLAAAH